jgi:glutamine synthetase type III
VRPFRPQSDKPFAFTGNKFEFRMVGSSQSNRHAHTYINLAVAQVLSEFADKLEKASDKAAAIQESSRNRIPSIAAWCSTGTAIPRNG